MAGQFISTAGIAILTAIANKQNILESKVVLSCNNGYSYLTKFRMYIAVCIMLLAFKTSYLVSRI